MLLVVLHRAIVRHVLIGQRDRKFVNYSLCNALYFYVAVYFFARVDSCRVDSLSSSLKSTRHTSQLDTWSTRYMCRVDHMSS